MTGSLSTLSPVAVTMGDPAGIGPEIIVKAFRDAPELTRHCFVVGDLATLRRASAVVCGDHPPMPMAPPYGYAPVPTAAAYGFHPQQGYVVGVQTLYHTTSPSYVWAAYPSPAMTSPIPEPHPPHFAPGPVYCSGWEGVAAAGTGRLHAIHDGTTSDH